MDRMIKDARSQVEIKCLQYWTVNEHWPKQ